MVWYFIGVCIINRTLHGRLEIQNFSSRVEKYFMAHVEKNINNKIISLYKLCAISYSVNWDHKERPLERKQVYA